ncbi:MAG: hypothetical protein HC890_07010 [Chloroflexaceae bacterium]|nr:hypothetical protein [Chloroflexaceae bacterium]
MESTLSQLLPLSEDSIDEMLLLSGANLFPFLLNSIFQENISNIFAVAIAVSNSDGDATAIVDIDINQVNNFTFEVDSFEEQVFLSSLFNSIFQSNFSDITSIAIALSLSGGNATSLVNITVNQENNIDIVFEGEEPIGLVTSLEFRQRPNQLQMETLLEGQIIERTNGRQNQPAPGSDLFEIFAVDSSDLLAPRRRQSFRDRTFFDQGEGIGITDGEDSTPATAKRIEKDEILGIAVENFAADRGILTVDRLASDNGASILVEAFAENELVDSQVFNLGQVASPQTLNFISDGLFDTLQISAADQDTSFTFRGLELPEAVTV